MARPLVLLLVFFAGAGCAAPPPANPSNAASGDRRTLDGLKADLAKLRAPSIASKCSAGAPPEGDKAQVWGKDDASPGIPPEQVETFLCLHRHEVESVCWDAKFSNWERSEAEYGLVVDPSGSVLGAMSPDRDGAATAALERHGARVDSPELARCIESVVDGWKFPRATMPTWMTLSFRFRQ